MSKTAAKFRQADITRAVKGARDAGLSVSRLSVNPVTGAIEIFVGDARAEPTNAYDKWVEAHGNAG